MTTRDPDLASPPAAAPVGGQSDSSGRPDAPEPEAAEEAVSEDASGTTTPARPPGGRHPGRRLDMAALAALAVALRLPALLSPRHLTFDDGVYGASAVAMRDGGLPFADVFSSQGPAFLPLVAAADLLGAHTLDAPRLLTVAAGVVLTVAAYLVGCEVAGRRAGVVAALLTTTAGSLLWVTGPIAADGPSLAAAAVALLLALRYQRRPSTVRALGIGAATGLAVSVKLMAAPILVPVAWVLLVGALERRPPDADGEPSGLRLDGVGGTRLVTAAALASLFWLVPSAVFGFAAVWDQAVTYHTEVAHGRNPVDNVGKVVSTFVDRDLVLALAAAGAIGAALVRSRRRRAPGADVAATTGNPGAGIRTSAASSGVTALARSVAVERDRGWSRLLTQPTPRTLVVAWLMAIVVLLLYVHPLWRPHVSNLIVPVALLVAMVPLSRRALVVGMVVLAPLGVWRVADYLSPAPYAPITVALHEHLDALPADAWVISDEPGHVWRAGRRTPDDLVDASILRIESGRITAASLTEAAADPRVCALVVWSSVRFGSFPDLGERLATVGYASEATFGDHRVLYTRASCDPPT
jgi:hypothetical protein